jgi:predicted nucleic acid-binding protein
MIELLNALAGILTPVDINFLWRLQLRDPADEMVLETAVNGRTSALVTWNTRDFLPAANKFELRIMRPDDFWAEFMNTGFERSK